jgi:hypothetical protein
MPNAIFGRHPVSSLARRCPSPALACRRRSTPLSLATIAVHGSCRKPSQLSPPILDSCEGAECGDHRQWRWRRCQCWTSLLSTLDPSNTLWNPDCLNMSNSCGSSHPSSDPIATSIIHGPHPTPLFGKTTSGILVLVACRFLDPPCPPQMSSPLSSIQLVLQERPELPRDDHVWEGHVAGYRELLDEQSLQSLRLAEEARSEVIPR